MHRKTLTLAPPGKLGPDGVAVPCKVNPETGLIAIQIWVAGNPYTVAVDYGSAYTWFAQGTVRKWVAEHPDWKRETGAVGESNMQMMTDWGVGLNQLPAEVRGGRVAEFLAAHLEPGREASGIIVRIPFLEIGSLSLNQVGALSVKDIFEWYSRKTPVPGVGWLGGNVLKGFRLTIDFVHRVTYWRRETDLDPHDLDQVGLTLLSVGDEYFVGGVASQNGRSTIEGVDLGDKLVKIDQLNTTGASRGAVLSALHGEPGAIRSITVERNGTAITIHAPVTRF
jgi:hypothetical protein